MTFPAFSKLFREENSITMLFCLSCEIKMLMQNLSEYLAVDNQLIIYIFAFKAKCRKLSYRHMIHGNLGNVSNPAAPLIPFSKKYPP